VYKLSAKLWAEFLGSLFLVMAAISPIILFHQTLQSSIGLAVLADAVAVGWILFALIEIFGDVELVPGISSIQVAASKAQVPLDKSKVITMHVTTPIEEKKLDLQKAVIDGQSVILIPRPWPNDPQKHFMPSEVAFYLKKNGFDTPKIPVHVFESLTNGKEQTFTGSVQDLEGKEFSDLSVMVISQTKPESYINF